MQTAIYFLLAGILLTWSLGTIVIESSASVQRKLAEKLEAGGSKLRHPQHLAWIEQMLSVDSLLSLCAREIVRSTVSIRLAMVDAAYRHGDANNRQVALGSAREALQRGLWCFPRDGNAWLRLAMVESALMGTSENVATMLRTSIVMAPNEGWIIAPRIEFAASLRSSKVDTVEAVLRTDIKTFAGYAPVSTVAALYKHMDTQTRAQLIAEVAGLDAARRAAIESATRPLPTQQGEGK